MAQNKRYTPAIPERPERPIPGPQYLKWISFIEPPAAANLVIAFRYGQGVLAASTDYVAPQYQRFPYFDQTQQPAFPVIPLQVRLLVELDDEAFPDVRPQYQRFPYWQEPPPASASPIIGIRYGRDILADPSAFIELGYQRFPYFQAVPAIIPIRLGQDMGRGIGQLVMIQPVYYTFPYRPPSGLSNKASTLLAQRPSIHDPTRLRARIHRRPH